MHRLAAFLSLWILAAASAVAELSFTFSSPTDIAVTASGYTAGGNLDLTLNFQPTPGRNLTVVKNTGPAFISGIFDTVPQGASVPLTFNGVTYNYIANYYGGNGRSLVLQWPLTGVAASGSNQYGQLGNRGISDQTSPVAVLQRGVLAGAVVTQIDAGMNHTLALSADSRIFSWGDNAAGQLGNGGSARSNVPVAVDRSGALAGRTVVAVSGGGNFSLALDSGGLAYAWGENYSGNLGIGGTIPGFTYPNLVPVAVDTNGVLNGKNLTAIAAGNYHALALSSEGKVYAWGSNSSGALGNNYANDTFTGSSVPVAVDTSGAMSGKTIVAIDAGYYSSLALSADGQVFSWGYNAQQGNGSSPVPVALSASGAMAGKTIVAIAIGGNSSYNGLALDSDGKIYTWGFDIASANGTVGSSGPVEVNTGSVLNGKTVVAISGRSSRCTVHTSDGMVYRWQQDATSGGLVPVVASGELAGSFVSAITGGDAHSVELMDAGSPRILRQPWARTLAQGQTATFTAKVGNEFPSTVKWQISQTGPSGNFTDITENPTATTDTLALDGVSPSQNGHAFRAVFSNASGSHTSEPATLSVVNWSATFTSTTHVPFTGDAITASGSLDLQLGFAPTPGADLTVIRTRGTEFIAGTFANVPQGGTVALTYNSITYNYIADYHGGNGRSLVLHWPRTRLMAWGDNGSGELGTGDSIQRLVPTEVVPPTAMRGNVTKLAASGSFSMALTAAGQLFTWGSTSYGRLGTSTSTPYLPAEVTASGPLAGKILVDISTAGHCLALTSEGRVYAWGLNENSQVGIGSPDYSVPTPVELPPERFDGQPVVMISAGMNHSMALTADGRVFSWGNNTSGKTGNAKTTLYTPTPTEIITSEDLAGLTIVDIAAGDGHSLAMASDGRLFAWGDPTYTGTASPGLSVPSPKPVVMSGALAGKTITGIEAEWHNLVLTSDGKVIGWGSNDYGQLGPGTFVDVPLPITINDEALAGKIVSSIFCGNGHSVATTTDGGAFTWGKNDDGQLGDGTTIDKTSPVAVATLGGANGLKTISMAAGGSHTLALVDAGPPQVTTQPLNRTAAAGATVTFTTAATDPFGYDIKWQVSTSGPAGPFTDVSDNATAATSTLVLDNVTSAQNQWAWRAMFSNTSGSSVTTPAVLNIITWSGTLTSATNIPNQAANPIVGGTLGLQLNFSPAAGTNLTVLQNTGLSFITGTFDNIPQGGRVTLSFGGVNYDFIANYYGGNGRSLVLQWPWIKIASWGSNSSGQLGLSPQGIRLPPTEIPGNGAPAGVIWTSIATGRNHSMALSSDGRVFSWGSNSSGQLGNGSASSTSSMVGASTNGVLAGKSIVSVVGRGDHALALSSTGEVFSWGKNFYGQLGNHTKTSSSTPVAVAGDGSLSGKSVTAIAAGGDFSVALTADGTVHTWGYNYYGQLGDGTNVNASAPVEVDRFGGLAGKTVTAVAAGDLHVLALTSDGHIYTWGDNSSGQLGNNSSTASTVPVAVTVSGALVGKTVVAIAAGGNHSLALTSDGMVFSWGQNSYGQIGDGSITSRPAPVPTGEGSSLAGKTVVHITAGDSYSSALTADGKLFSWGRNDSGQLGDGTTTDRPSPFQVNTSGLLAGKAMTHLSAGGSHAITLYSGDGLPVVIENPKNRTAIQSGSPGATVNFSAEAKDLFPLTVHWQVSPTGSSGPFSDITGNASASTATLTLSDVAQNLDGSAYRAVFTNNNGSVTTAAATLSITTIATSFNFSSPSTILLSIADVTVSGALDITLGFAPIPGVDLTVIKNTGASFISGSFSNLPQGATIPLTYGGITHSFIVDYFGGSGRSLVLHWKDRLPAGWGIGNTGQLGAGNNTSTNRIPVAVDANGAMAGQSVVKLAGGAKFSLALSVSGRVFSWGANALGELGNGTTTSSNVPGEVDTSGELAGKQVVAIAAGDSHSLALTADGQIVAWGTNAYGQLGYGGAPNDSSAIPVSVKRDGVLTGKTVTAITAGQYHNVALTSDGTLVAWGRNSSGQLGNGTTTTAPVPVMVLNNGALTGKTVTAIAAGGAHTLALTADGRVYAWGSNQLGQLGNGSNSPPFSSTPTAITGGGLIAGKSVVAIAAGANHSLAVTADGKVYAWGYGDSGQLGNGGFSTYAPTAVSTTGALAGKSVIAISAGGNHSLAISSDGLGYAWGNNDYGQLGNNSFSSVYTPVAMSTQGAIGSRPLVALAAGASHSLAIAGRGTAPTVTQAPVSQTVVAGGTVSLTAAAVGYPAPTVRWQRSTTGPGGSFTNLSGQTAPTLELANIASSQTGYAYRAVFTNLESIANSAAASLTVQATFGNFLVSRGLPADNSPVDDPFHTGVPHLIAYAFDLNPASPDLTKLPTAVSVGGRLRISYTRWRNATDLRYTAEVSNGLNSWTSGPGTTEIVSVTPINNARETVVEQEILPDSTPTRFLRVRVELDP